MSGRAARAAKRRKVSKRTKWRKLLPHEIGETTRFWLEYDRIAKAYFDENRERIP